MKINTKTSPGNTKSLTGSDNVTIYKSLSVISSPTSPQSVVNKSYLEDNYNLSIPKTGDIRFTMTPNTPDGYLRCNGGVVDKLSFPELYSVIGDSFFPSVRMGCGKPHVHQYDFNMTLSREMYNWTQGTSLAASNAYIDCMVTKNRVFLFGRFNGSTYTTTCYTATIQASGFLGNWTTSSSLPLTASASQTVIFNGCIYVLGGYGGGTTYRNRVYKSVLTSDGSLGSWETYQSLPFTVYRSQAIVTKNRLYIIGGIINGVSSNLVYYTNIDENGNFGIWVQGPSLPVDVSDHSVTIIKNKVYVFGGVSNGVDSAYCWVGVLNSDGAIINWTSTDSLPEPNKANSIVTVRNRVYLFGGIISGSPSTKVYSSAINPDGTLAGWEIYGDLPSSFYAGTALLTSKALYLIGGYRGGAVSNRTDYTDATGGLDQYGTYYNAGVYPTDPDKFTLPDYSKLELDNNMYAFVKT